MKTILISLFALAALAQTVTGPRIDNSAASSTKPFKEASSEPSTCAVGTFYTNTATGATRKCVATNTWGDVVIADAAGNVVVGTALPVGAPAGTVGASIIYSPNAALNVKAFGALGNGVHDDTAAINSALATGAHLFFPSGDYLVSGNGLNLTNLRSVTLTGNPGNTVGEGTVFRCGTAANACLDLTGAQYISLRDLFITTAATNPSVLGILAADSSTSDSGSLSLSGVTIFLGTDATANGNNGTVALYNYGFEAGYYSHSTLWADNALVLSTTNLFSLASVNATIKTDGTSMCNSGVTDTTTLAGRLGPALYLSGACDVTIEGSSYLARISGGTYAYAVKMAGTGNNVKINSHVEGFPSYATITGTYKGLVLLGDMANAGADTIYLDGSVTSPTVSGAEINVVPLDGTANNLINCAATVTSMDSTHVVLYSNQRINTNCGGSFNGNKIDSQSNTPTIAVPETFSYWLIRGGAGAQFVTSASSASIFGVYGGSSSALPQMEVVPATANAFAFNTEIRLWGSSGKTGTQYASIQGGNQSDGTQALLRFLLNGGAALSFFYDKAATFASTVKATGYLSSDGSAGVTGSTCTAWKNGLCVAN